MKLALLKKNRPESKDEFKKENVSDKQYRAIFILSERIVSVRGKAETQFLVVWQGAYLNSWEFADDVGPGLVTRYRINKPFITMCCSQHKIYFDAVIINLTTSPWMRVYEAIQKCFQDLIQSKKNARGNVLYGSRENVPAISVDPHEMANILKDLLASANNHDILATTLSPPNKNITERTPDIFRIRSISPQNLILGNESSATYDQFKRAMEAALGNGISWDSLAREHRMAVFIPKTFSESVNTGHDGAVEIKEQDSYITFKYVNNCVKSNEKSLRTCAYCNFNPPEMAPLTFGASEEDIKAFSAARRPPVGIICTCTDAPKVAIFSLVLNIPIRFVDTNLANSRLRFPGLQLHDR